MENINNNCDIIKIILFVILIAIILWILFSVFNPNHETAAENFCPKSVKSMEQEQEQEQENNYVLKPNVPCNYKPVKEIPLKPSCDTNTDTKTINKIINTSIEYAPQDQYFTPWGSIIKIGDNNSTPSETSIADYTLSFNQCSPSCCSDQWPVPFKTSDDTLCGNKNEFVKNNYYCNNGWQNSGCLCMTQKQSDFLKTRGSNAGFVV